MIVDGVVITAALALLALLLSGLFARRLVRPIHGLSQVVRHIQEGELSARTQASGSGELRELEDGVNAMAQRVEEASDVLQRRVEEATTDLSRTLQDLEQRNAELERARASAEAASQTKDLFLARMSHELRTPLASVVGFANLLKDEPAAARRSHYGELIDRGASLLTATIDDILHFVKLQSGSLRLEQVEFDLPACLESVVLMHAPAAQARQLELDCLLASNLPLKVRGDPVRLAQILNNLLSNAVKFTINGGVQVRAESRSLHEQRCVLELRVIDTGIGVDDTDAEQLFDPFRQADESTTRQFGGSGLGLSICRRLARLMDGDVEFRSGDGEGTEVLARVKLEVVSAAPIEHYECSDGIDVLLLDGTAACAEVIAEYLGPWRPRVRHLGFAEGLACLEQRGFDLVVAGVNQDPDSLRARHSGPLLTLQQETALPAGATALSMPGTMTVTRPLSRAGLRAAWQSLCGQQEEAADAAPVQAASCMRCSVLVAEDNELNRLLVGDQLRRRGARVVMAGDAAEALAIAQEQFFDLVLMDVHMPGMTGVDLARALTRCVPELPVYALTANVIGTEEPALEAAGVREVLYKPLADDQLQRLLSLHGEADLAAVAESGPTYGLNDADFVRACMREMEDLADAIEVAVSAGDCTTVASAAHDLTGLARISAMVRLADAASALEGAARSRDVDRLDELKAALRAFIPAT